VFFERATDFRAWLAEHHDSASELLVGFFKVGSGRASMTWSESVDAALCFGWIDGVVRRIDASRYSIRFTPRRPGSVWSAVNVAKVEALTAAGLMTPAGTAAFAARREDRTAIYSHEQDDPERLTLSQHEEAHVRASPSAWEFFTSQAPSYQRAVAHWIHSAKRPETQKRRLAELVTACAEGRPVAQFRRR
jgi:uncharacterized protein YdeI (YjbR/CyaY-like superfamily)